MGTEEIKRGFDWVEMGETSLVRERRAWDGDRRLVSLEWAGSLESGEPEMDGELKASLVIVGYLISSGSATWRDVLGRCTRQPAPTDKVVMVTSRCHMAEEWALLLPSYCLSIYHFGLLYTQYLS